MKLLLLTLALFVSSQAMASKYSFCCNDDNHDHEIQYIDNSTHVTEEVTKYVRFENTDHAKGIAASAAVANIPTVAHGDTHNGHFAVGVGLSSYDQYTGIALGLEYHSDDNVFKINAGKSGDEAIVGGGYSWTFD